MVQAPGKCAALPADGSCAFEDIYMEVDGKPVAAPQWESVIGKAVGCARAFLARDYMRFHGSYRVSNNGD